MKYILIVGDGMADLPIEELGGRTPMEAVSAPCMARVGGGTLGRVRTCPEGLPPGSDVAFLNILGHDPIKCYRGRSPLEAAGEHVELKEDEVSFRMNLISVGGEYADGTMASYNGDGVDGPDALELVSDLIHDPEFAAIMKKADMVITPTPTFRHIAVVKANDEPFDLTPPHDIAGQAIAGYQPKVQKAEALTALQVRAYEFLSQHPVNLRRAEKGLMKANGVWFWGAGRATILEDFTERYQKTGTAISAVPLVRGIAWLSGLKAPRIDGATGTLETNYEGKVEAALNALRSGDDFVLLHTEAPDDLSHSGSLEGKMEAIRRLEERMVRPVMKALDEWEDDYRLMVMPDHYTLLSTCTHDATPAPFAIYDSRIPGKARAFTEKACADKPVLESGDALMRLFLEEDESL